jgi:hypothetical protein
VSESPDPSDVQEVPEAAHPTAAHGAFVRIMIVVTTLLTIAMVGVLSFRWFTTEEPTSYIQVDGDASLDGVDVRVEGGALPHAMQMTISPVNNYRARFFVQPGHYTVRLLRGNRELRASGVDLFAEQYMQMDLRGVDLTSPPSRRGKGKP